MGYLSRRATGTSQRGTGLSNHSNRKRRRSSGACIEPLDRRVLLAVNFTFNIIDPQNQHASFKPKLQALLNAAGQEWSTHLVGNATLEYDVAFESGVQSGSVVTLATGAAKSAQIIGTDTLTGSGADVYQVGTAREILTGVDPNGVAADGGITIAGNYTSLWYVDPQLNRRTDPIPEGKYDGYSILLHELAHTLGFVSTRDALGNVPQVGMYIYDQHVTGFGFLDFGLTAFEKTQLGVPQEDAVDDATISVYGESVSLEIGNPNELGNGRFFDTGVVNQFPQFSFEFEDDLTTDLMGGQIIAGERKTISRLDLAILKDAGTPVDLTVDPTPEGIFTINGTGLSDVIDVTLTNGTLLVRVNKSVQSIDAEDSQDITAIIINGLNGNDVITISGAAPAVAINGGAGNDSIYGGTKGDSIFGGGGADLIFGRGGGDIIRGGDGNDVIYGQGGSDRLIGDAGNDYLNGGEQGDRMNGSGNADTLVGSTGDDFLFGDNGNDLLSGAGGKDRMDGGAGADAFYGGAGNDAVDYSKSLAAVTASIDGSPDDGFDGESDNIVDAENIIGSSLDDLLIGSEGANSLIGSAGNDTLIGNGGNDTLEGNNGNDSLEGGGGIDSLVGGDNDDQLIGGVGQDRLYGEFGNDNFVTRDDEIDTIEGGDGIDSIFGDNFDVLADIESADLDGPLQPNP